jgi:hypothetical protein
VERFSLRKLHEVEGKEKHHDDVSYSQSYWGSGLCPASGILKARKHNVSETGSVCVLR